MATWLRVYRFSKEAIRAESRLTRERGHMGWEEVGSGGYASPATWSLSRWASKSHTLQVWGQGLFLWPAPGDLRIRPWGLRGGNEVLCVAPPPSKEGGKKIAWNLLV